MKRMCLCFGIVFLVTILMGGLSVADPVVTIEGTMNDDYQLVTDDGKAYEIDAYEENEATAEKLSEETNKRVKVKGEVETDISGTKTINVVSYEVIDTKNPQK